MSLRARLTLAAAGAVAIAVLLASIGVYFVVRSQLRGEVDTSLRERATVIQSVVRSGDLRATVPPNLPAVPPADLGRASGYLQVVSRDGAVTRGPGARVAVPVDARTLAVARGEEGTFLADSTVAGTHVRVITASIRGARALQLVRPLDEVDGVLKRLRWILLSIAVLGVALAVLLGAAVSRTALRPVRRLTETAENVSRTLDLSERIESTGTDEVGRLAASFNRMLEALEGSVGTQRQLVADASHELRTPLTSLRVNIETLMRGDSLSHEDRSRLSEDVVEQLAEMTTLIDEVVEVARGDEPEAELERLRFDLVVSDCVERAHRNAPGVEFASDLAPVVVRGVPARLERAVANLLDNARKWSPPGGRVDVVLDAAGALVVRDRGAGIAAEDLPHVFDRFYRSKDSRSLPGSGLGLAIVRQVAEAHGGSVRAENAPDGGAILRFSIPLDIS